MAFNKYEEIGKIHEKVDELGLMITHKKQNFKDGSPMAERIIIYKKLGDEYTDPILSMIGKADAPLMDLEATVRGFGEYSIEEVHIMYSDIIEKLNLLY